MRATRAYVCVVPICLESISTMLHSPASAASDKARARSPGDHAKGRQSARAGSSAPPARRPFAPSRGVSSTLDPLSNPAARRARPSSTTLPTRRWQATWQARLASSLDARSRRQRGPACAGSGSRRTTVAMRRGWLAFLRSAMGRRLIGLAVLFRRAPDRWRSVATCAPPPHALVQARREARPPWAGTSDTAPRGSVRCFPAA